MTTLAIMTLIFSNQVWHDRTSSQDDDKVDSEQLLNILIGERQVWRAEGLTASGGRGNERGAADVLERRRAEGVPVVCRQI